MPETNARIKVCHDTAANFKTNNPTLLVGEWALETDTKKMKIGDGSTAYNALPYSTAEDSDEWIKPADWVDIRSGAINNSVYALVAHSAPVESEGTYTISNYSVFGFYVTVSNNGTYDVFVDGNKVATSANASSTVIDFAQLYNNGTLVGGSDVTYPAALTTHIVRITPTLDTNNIIRIQQAAFESDTNTGILWVHFTTKSAINLTYFIYGNNNKGYAPLLEAITSSGNDLLVSDITAVGAKGVSLRELPWFDGGGAVVQATYCCQNAPLIKTFKFKNMTITAAGLCWGNAGLEKILYENVTFKLTAYGTYNGCRKLTSIPANFSLLYNNQIEDLIFNNATNLKIPLLELSKFSSCQRINLGGRSTSKLYGIKGLTVSNEAPFTGSSPQIDVAYTGLDRAALINLFKSMPYNVGYTVVGSPTIVDGIVSDFRDSPAAYLKTNSSVPAWSDISELDINVKARVTTSNQFGYVLHTSNSVAICTGGGADIFIVYISGQSRYDIPYTLNTYYDIRVHLKDNVWSIYLNGVLKKTYEMTSPITSSTTPVGFGNNYTGTNSLGFRGSIDLNETYIKINGVPWFTGKAAMTKTCSIVGCTGTADLTQADKNIALNKGWELTVA